jgi:hypothetical protein
MSDPSSDSELEIKYAPQLRRSRLAEWQRARRRGEPFEMTVAQWRVELIVRAVEAGKNPGDAQALLEAREFLLGQFRQGESVPMELLELDDQTVKDLAARQGEHRA